MTEGRHSGRPGLGARPPGRRPFERHGARPPGRRSLERHRSPGRRPSRDKGARPPGRRPYDRRHATDAPGDRRSTGQPPQGVLRECRPKRGCEPTTRMSPRRETPSVVRAPPAHTAAARCPHRRRLPSSCRHHRRRRRRGVTSPAWALLCGVARDRGWLAGRQGGRER